MAAREEERCHEIESLKQQLAAAQALLKTEKYEHSHTLSQRDNTQAEALKQAADAGKLEFQLRAWREAVRDAIRDFEHGEPPNPVLRQLADTAKALRDGSPPAASKITPEQFATLERIGDPANCSVCGKPLLISIAVHLEAGVVYVDGTGYGARHRECAGYHFDREGLRKAIEETVKTFCDAGSPAAAQGESR